MPDCHCSHAVPNTFAITFEYLSCCGVFFGACAMISGVSGGPTTPPGVRMPTTALMMTPWMVVVVNHCEIAPQIASQAKASLMNPGLAVTGIATVCAVGLPCDKIPNFPPPYPLMADASYPLVVDASAQISGGDVVAGPLITTSGDARAHADGVPARSELLGQAPGRVVGGDYVDVAAAQAGP